MDTDLKQRLINRMKQVGAFDVRVANPRSGYRHALPGQHPLEVWPQCNSVVIYSVACSPKSNNLHFGPYSPWPEKDRKVGTVPPYIQSTEFAMDRLWRLFAASITASGMQILEEAGYQYTYKMPQLKLTAVEAGLSVYGRSGITLHPVLGSRIRLGCIMTDAGLEPDSRLEGFNPCEGCDKCIRICPARAFDPARSYPASYSREKCEAKRAQVEAQGYYCHNCFAVCPVGTVTDEQLLHIEEAKSIFRGEIPE